MLGFIQHSGTQVALLCCSGICNLSTDSDHFVYMLYCHAREAPVQYHVRLAILQSAEWTIGGALIYHWLIAKLISSAH